MMGRNRKTLGLETGLWSSPGAGASGPKPGLPMKTSMGAAPKLQNPPVPSSGGVPVKNENEGLFRLEAAHTDLGRADSLRYNILTWVLNESYDKALNELRVHLEKESPYPDFHMRVNRYISHSIDLIFAIKAKRNFPGLNSLTRAKQQEMREKFKEHFRELQYILTRIEKVETDLRINDARSTMYVIKALWIAGLCVVFTAFVMEIMQGLAITTGVVFDDSVTSMVGWLFDKIGM